MSSIGARPWRGKAGTSNELDTVIYYKGPDSPTATPGAGGVVLVPQPDPGLTRERGLDEVDYACPVCGEQHALYSSWETHLQAQKRAHPGPSRWYRLARWLLS